MHQQITWWFFKNQKGGTAEDLNITAYENYPTTCLALTP